MASDLYFRTSAIKKGCGEAGRKRRMRKGRGVMSE